MTRYYKIGTKYWVYNDNTQKPIIIMIHGFRGTHHGLELIAKNLEKYRIIIPDLPGFGETKPLKDSHSLENYTIWLHDFIKDLGLKNQPILLGHSFGTIITSNYASKYPETIKKLILVNPIGAPALKGPRMVMTWLTLAGHKIASILPEPIGAKLISSKPFVMTMSIVMAKTKDKKTRKFIHNEHLKHFSSFTNIKTVTEAFKTSINHSVLDVAQKITIPTLLIVGDRDDITTLKKQELLSGLIKNSKLKVIKNVGHLTHYETPEIVANFIKEFTN